LPKIDAFKFADYTILSKGGGEGYRQYQSALRSFNNHLRALSQLLGLRENLTSYVARHSWATAAYREGVPVSVISECLGHSSEKVTYNYLASFANRTLRRANRKVISLLMPPISPPLPSSGMPKRKWRNKAFG
jgi:integrase